jgi:hypothetical protein
MKAGYQLIYRKDLSDDQVRAILELDENQGLRPATTISSAEPDLR